MTRGTLFALLPAAVAGAVGILLGVDLERTAEREGADTIAGALRRMDARLDAAETAAARETAVEGQLGQLRATDEQIAAYVVQLAKRVERLETR